MRLETFTEVRSGSLLDRADADAWYILAGSISDGTLHPERFADGGLPEKSKDAASLVDGDVVVSLRGSRNNAAPVDGIQDLDRPVFATLDIAILRPGQAVRPAYLAWYLNLPATQDSFGVHRSGSAAPRLPLSALKQLDVPLPSLARQDAIVALARDATLESSLLTRIQQSRQRLLNERLRRSAEDRPSFPGSPA